MGEGTLSSDDAWSIPDSNAMPAGSAAPVEPAAAPAAVAGSDAVVAGSDAAFGTLPGAGAGIEGGLGVIERPRTVQPDRVLWLVAAWLFLLAGSAEIVYLFGHSEVFFAGQSNYDVLAVVADHGLRAVVLLACSALLLLPRTRELAAGLALSTSALSIAYNFGQFRPLVFKLEDHLAVWSSVGGLASVTVGGVVVLVAVIRSRRGRAGRRRQARVDRVAAVTLGFFGAALVLLGLCIDYFRVELGLGTDQETIECCGWSHATNWTRAEMAVGGFVLLLLAVLAATLSSKILAAGMLAGAAVQPLPTFVQVIMLIVAPTRSFYGFGATQDELASRISTGPAAGFWLDLFGMLLLVGAAVARLRLGPHRNPYSAQPYAEPGHSAPTV